MSQYSKKRRKAPLEGRDLASEPLTEAELVDYTKKAEYTAMWHLARRDMTVKEVEKKLKQKFYPTEIIETVVNKLLNANYINDERYTANFIRSSIQYNKLGKLAIKQKLILKGIDSSLFYLLDIIDSEDEYIQAREILDKRLNSIQKLDRVKATQRLVGMLARKGYSSDICFRVVKEFLDENNIK